MHYYTRHLGDYAKDTGHLSLLEHGIYTVLLDWSYATERPLPEENEAVYRICRASSAAEKRSVDKVVLEFFPTTDGQRKNKRAEVEIYEFRSKSTKATLAAAKRWKCDSNANVLPSHPDGNTTRARVPLTSTQYPITIQSDADASASGGANFPGVAAALDYFAKNGSDYLPDQVRAAWHECNTTVAEGHWLDWNGRTRVGDWRSRMENVLARRFSSGQPGAGGENKKNGGDSRTPAQARFELSKELEAIRERLDAAHETAVQPDPEDVNRERQIERELEAIA